MLAALSGQLFFFFFFNNTIGMSYKMQRYCFQILKLKIRKIVAVSKTVEGCISGGE
jgi:hypothetical protein